MLEGHRQRKELPDSSSSSSSHSARQSAQREEQNKTAGKGQKPLSCYVSDSWSSSMMLVILKKKIMYPNRANWSQEEENDGEGRDQKGQRVLNLLLHLNS